MLPTHVNEQSINHIVHILLTSAKKKKKKTTLRECHTDYLFYDFICLIMQYDNFLFQARSIFIDSERFAFINSLEPSTFQYFNSNNCID